MEITIKINGRFVSVEVSAEVADYLEQAKRNNRKLYRERQRYWDGRECDEYMRYFTSNPLERLMMQAPPPRQEQRAKPAPPKDHPCHGCKRCGESCVLPCYRGVEVIPPIPSPDRARSR